MTNPGIEQAASDREFMLPVSEFDLPGTLDGGQAFRWHREGDGYRGVIGRSVLHVSIQTAGQVRVRVLAGESVQPEDVAGYLGLDFDLDAFRKRHASDSGLAPALAACAGLLVLRHDPWECLFGFIFSARTKIPPIKRKVPAPPAGAGGRSAPGAGLRGSAGGPAGRQSMPTGHGRSKPSSTGGKLCMETMAGAPPGAVTPETTSSMAW